MALPIWNPPLKRSPKAGWQALKQCLRRPMNLALRFGRATLPRSRRNSLANPAPPARQGSRPTALLTAGMLALAVYAGAGANAADQGERPPNFVIVFLDDSGWSDFEPFDVNRYVTPNVRKLAEGGCRFNNFCVPQAVCSASRSALMTGCYPGRTKVFGTHPPKARARAC